MTILSDVDTLAKASLALRNGEVSAVELTEACLDRCTALEPTVSSFITLTKTDAMAMAQAADARRRAGDDVSPITGIPLAFKDIIDIAGVRGTGHSRLYAHRIAPHDAEVVARLRTQGAVFLGKVTTNEFAIGAHDQSALVANARNPWNPEHSPGGSSSGSGTSVAAGEAFGALGTDTGGSIRVPAAFNGIVGLKPSYGLVSRRGVMPLSDSMDNVGPMARSVEDVAILLDAIVSPQDDAAAAIVRNAKSFRDASSEMPYDAGYIRVRDFDHLLPEAHLQALDQTEAMLQALGVVQKPDAFTDLEELDAVSAVIATCESWSYHRERLAAYPKLYGRDARLKLHIGALISGDDYLLAKARQVELVRAFEKTMSPADILLLPTTLGPAPKLPAPDGPINFRHWSHTGLNGFANALQGPALAMPCGMASGLPLSMQLVARHGSDATVLAIARGLERETAKTNCAQLQVPLPQVAGTRRHSNHKCHDE